MATNISLKDARLFVENALKAAGSSVDVSKKRRPGLREALVKAKVDFKVLQEFDRLFPEPATAQEPPAKSGDDTKPEGNKPEGEKPEDKKSDGDKPEEKKSEGDEKKPKKPWYKRVWVWIFFILPALFATGVWFFSLPEVDKWGIGAQLFIVIISSLGIFGLWKCQERFPVAKVFGSAAIIAAFLGGIQSVHRADGDPNTYFRFSGGVANWTMVIAGVVLVAVVTLIAWIVATKTPKLFKAITLSTLLLLGIAYTYFVTFEVHLSEANMIAQTQKDLDGGTNPAPMAPAND